MANQDHLSEILDRILKGHQTEADIDQLRRSLKIVEGVLQLVSQDGKLNTNIGQINGGDIHIGDRIYQGADADLIRSICKEEFQKLAQVKDIKPENYVKTRMQTQTPNSPRIVGFLIDVSESMISSTQNRSDKQPNRFDNFRESLRKAVDRVKELPKEAKNSQRFFALGFGCGSFRAVVLGDSGEKVRDLLILPDSDDSTVSLQQLIDDWEAYEKNIDKMVWRMGGGTPMKQAFLSAEERFESYLGQPPYNNEPILFILSDGEPTDASADEVLSIAKQLKNKGILIISCYLTQNDVVKYKYLYSQPSSEWEEGAKLMFECASVAKPNSPIHEYFKEKKWEFQSPEKSRIFAQINETNILSEYTESINSFINKEYP